MKQYRNVCMRNETQRMMLGGANGLMTEIEVTLLKSFID